MSTIAPVTSTLGLPVAAIVCIAIGAYVVLIVLILAIRSILLSRGVCKQSCGCCGKEGEPCCECCSSFSECCACDSPSLTACLDSICPSRKQMDFGDFVTCQCCSDPNNQCCNSQQPFCDCGACQVSCAQPGCDDITCCGCKLQSKPLPDDTDE